MCTELLENTAGCHTQRYKDQLIRSDVVSRNIIYYFKILCPVDRISRYIHLKKNQHDAQIIFSIFRQTPLHVSGVSVAHHQEVHLARTTEGHLKRTISNNFCIQTVVPPDDGL